MMVHEMAIAKRTYGGLLYPHFFSLLIFHSEIPRRHMIALAENPVEVAAVFVSHGGDNVTDRQIGIAHERHRLIEALALEQFLKIKSCTLFNHTAQRVNREVEPRAQLSECGGSVVLLYIIERRHGDHIVILIRHAHLHILYRVDQIEE